MKNLAFLILALFLFCCSKEKKEADDSKNDKSETFAEPKIGQNPVPLETTISTPRILDSLSDKVNYEYVSWDIKEDLQKLDSFYPYTPFYGIIGDEKFFIVRNQSWDYGEEWFNDSIQYGLLNNRYEMVLGMDYAKIGNPNLILNDCFELQQNGKYGLYNHKTNEILKPQFEYFLSSPLTHGKVAYGLKNGRWFEITSEANLELIQTEIDIVEILKKVSFDVAQLGESLMFYCYSETYEEDATTGRGVVVFPSFIEKLNLLDNEIIWDLITSKKYAENFGTTNERVKLSESRSVGDRLISFFVSIYRSGIDGRGYEIESKKLLTFNQRGQKTNSSFLGRLTMYDYFCRESDYRFVNDSIVEIKSNTQEGDLYDFETKYSFKQVLPDGDIQDLSSNRIFDFTKFILIGEEYFKGCFGRFVENEKYDGGENIWVTEHLSNEDLDVMRNEIFADYGYKFQTEKWQKYFGEKSWYKPLFDDVNDKLSEIDKANLKTILGVKKRMEGREDQFTKKRASTYYAAG